MSVAGISSSSLFDYSRQNIQSRMQQVQQEFQQLGQDLSSGNLSAAQTDFAALQKLQPQSSATSAASGSSPLAQDFNQLSQDLQSGNISNAQHDYTKIQQDFQSQASQMHAHVITTGAEAANRAPPANCWPNWVRPCNRATWRRRSRHTAACSRTSRSLRKVTGLRRRRRNPVRASFPLMLKPR
jgi:hypothetical protein